MSSFQALIPQENLDGYTLQVIGPQIFLTLILTRFSKFKIRNKKS